MSDATVNVLQSCCVGIGLAFVLAQTSATCVAASLTRRMRRSVHAHTCFIALACLSATAHAELPGLTLESINSQTQEGHYHVIKLINTGKDRFAGAMKIRRMRCHMEPPEQHTDNNPKLAEIREWLKRHRDARKGCLVFGGSTALVMLEPGSWLLWRIVQVPRNVSSCEMEILACANNNKIDCGHAEHMQLRNVEVKPEPGYTAHVETSVHRMHAALEGEVVLRLREITNLSPHPLLVRHVPGEEHFGACDAAPVSYAQAEAMNRLSGESVLQSGQRMYRVSAIKIRNARWSTCEATSTFIHSWIRKGALLHEDVIKEIQLLDFPGSGAQFVDDPDADIDYE